MGSAQTEPPEMAMGEMMMKIGRILAAALALALTIAFLAQRAVAEENLITADRADCPAAGKARP